MTVRFSRRVVVTGVGLISPLGHSKESLWEALSTGQSGIARLTSIPPDYFPTTIGAEVRDFTGEIGDFGSLQKEQLRAIKKGTKLMCREIQFGVAAAQRALQNAGLKIGDYEPTRSGALFGCDYIMTVPDEFTEAMRSCIDGGRFHFDRWAELGFSKITPLWLLKYLPNMPNSHVAIYNDLRGPNNALTVREASSNLAVAEAYCTILRGSADMMIAGATGTRVHPARTIHVSLQEQLSDDGVEPARASRPFDRDRTGMVIGEGAGAVILEELETARARGATIIGEVVGYGSSSVMDRRGVGQGDVAIRNVLVQSMQTSGLSTDDVGHVHAHGLATLKADREEARGIQAAFSSRKTPVPVTAAKSYFGNLGAGGGLVELIASLLALENGRLFPVLNHAHTADDCPVSVVASHNQPAGDSFINVNISPQGQAAAIAIRRFA